MNFLPYPVFIAFHHEYWRYLCAEPCDCTEERHVQCHKSMLRELESLNAWELRHGLFPKIRQRMTEFKAFTSNPSLRNVCDKVIERIDFIEKHKLS